MSAAPAPGAVQLDLTACVITFNEEANLPDCLRSVAFCREVVVVDSRSDDRTREIAREHGARVIERDWPGHIEQKNFAIAQASHEWVLCLDADERVTPALQAAIRAALGSGASDAADAAGAADVPGAAGAADAPGAPYAAGAADAAGADRVDGYLVNRRNIYLGRWIRRGGWYPDRKLRLFRRARGRWEGVNPHDHVRLDPGAATRPLGADLEHFTYRSIADHLRTIDYFSGIAAREKLARGQRWVGLNLLLNPPFKFVKMFVLGRGFLDGWRGLLVAALGAFYVFLRYAKLWELIHVQGRRPGEGGRVAYGRRGEATLEASPRGPAGAGGAAAGSPVPDGARPPPEP